MQGSNTHVDMMIQIEEFGWRLSDSRTLQRTSACTSGEQQWHFRSELSEQHHGSNPYSELAINPGVDTKFRMKISTSGWKKVGLIEQHRGTNLGFAGVGTWCKINRGYSLLWQTGPQVQSPTHRGRTKPHNQREGKRERWKRKQHSQG